MSISLNNTGSKNTVVPTASSVNTGSTHTGSTYTGSTNTGSTNTGSTNTGSKNTGSTNTGSKNTGSKNTGSKNTQVDMRDGTVDGTNGDDQIILGYTDADGDQVDGNDAILPGDVGDDDLIYGYGGDDNIVAGNGDDEVYGGTGNDTIVGDGGKTVVRESFEWDQATEQEVDTTFVQDTGAVDVTFTRLEDVNGHDSGLDTDQLNVDGIDSGSEAIDTDSSLESVTNGQNGSGKFQWAFSAPVTDVDFNINDIDGDGVVKITAYDANGNEIPVNLVGGSKLTLLDTDGVNGADTADSDGGYDDVDSSKYNLQVSIAGPVAKIVVEHTQDGSGNSGINITDMYYDVVTGEGAGGDDTLFGDEGDDSIMAGVGDDTVFGGTGNDILSGDEGDDTVYGGTGNDMIDGGSGDDILFGEDGDDKLEGSGGDDELYGGDGDDDLWAGANDDIVEGGDGNDSIDGGGGDDLIDGGDGNDTINGGNNDDSIIGGDGNDEVDGGSGDDVIDTSGDDNPLPDQAYPGVYGADDDPNNDLDTVYGGTGADTITTGDDNDTVFGGTGNDTIDVGVDDDYVEAGTGNDTVIGSEGNDEIYGNDGNDLIYGGLDPSFPDVLNIPDDGSGPFGPDLVTDNNNDTLFGGAGNDTIFGADDDDTLFGGTGKDYLDGGVDDDEIYGGDGNDIIRGGQGSDEQSGGFGNDTFIVDSAGDGAGDVVVGGEDPDDGDVDVLDLTGSNVDFITYVDGDPEAGTVTFLDGSTMTFSEIENVIPCFTPGTTIATPKGERLVEDLREGDRIITRDNGIQEIRWVGRKEMTGKHLVANPHLKPILIKAGALGNGLPERDMLVSPNHRMLVANDMTQLYFEEREVLAAAKHLVGSAGIHEIDVMGTAYIHFMFDRHEVVLGNGAWTESFQPGDYSLKGIGNGQRNEIFELFPELKTQGGLEDYQSARKALKKHEARLLVK